MRRSLRGREQVSYIACFILITHLFSLPPCKTVFSYRPTRCYTYPLSLFIATVRKKSKGKTAVPRKLTITSERRERAVLSVLVINREQITLAMVLQRRLETASYHREISRATSPRPLLVSFLLIQINLVKHHIDPELSPHSD